MNNFEEIPASTMSLAKRTLLYGIGINDANYLISKQVNGSKVTCPFYMNWADMLQRCYSKAYQVKKPTYIGCTVCPEWLTFSNFKEWMSQQDWFGKSLDKDILVKDNRIYSPETCIFVPQEINSLVVSQTFNKGKYKTGVVYMGNGKYKAQCSVKSKAKHLGYFKSEDLAHKAHIDFKKHLILEAAAQQTDNRLKQALIALTDRY